MPATLRETAGRVETLFSRRRYHLLVPELQALRGPILNPRQSIGIDFHADGILVIETGRIAFVGDAAEFARQGGDLGAAERLEGVLMPPMLDIHTHVPQWPIRGRFLEGVPEDPPGGRLLAGLGRNVFPAELRFDDQAFAAEVIERFRDDTLANGVAGGCVFMTVHPEAARLAFELLGDEWLIGPVLMDQNCPPGLRNDPATVAGPFAELAARFGQRLVLADRFALACSSRLRRAGVQLAKARGLRMQTHLAEQPAEVRLVRELYPQARSYAGIYQADGLLSRSAILAHCVHLAEEEWRLLREAGASLAHCPASNALLGSGIMSLEHARKFEAPFALATDVGASPTTSLLAEARQFLLVHGGQASPEEALWRITQAPAEILGMQRRFGRLRPGGPATYVLVDVEPAASAGETILRMLGAGSAARDRSIHDPPADLQAALAELRTGRASRSAVELLTADFHAAAARVGRVRQVVIDGVARHAGGHGAHHPK